MGGKFLFPLILTVLFVLIHYGAYRRIILHLHISAIARRWLSILLVLNLAAITGYLLSRYTLSPPKTLYFLLSLSLGFGFLLLIMLLLYEPLRALQSCLPADETKRLFFKRISDAGLIGAGAAFMGTGIYNGLKEPSITYVSVDQNRFDGKSYRIVQISDMHIGGLIERDFVRRSVEQINALEPDLIAITGDLCDAHVDTLRGALDELSHLQSRYGVFYIVGNHEYFHGIDDTLEYFKSLGFHVLENSLIQLDDFDIAGVYDLFGLRTHTHIPDIAQALQNQRNNKPLLLLAHQPKFISHLAGNEPALILSGHTHGGQVWPFGYLVSLAQPYLKGLHPIGENRHIYVNSGIGFWGPPMRLGSHSEITCITWS